MPQGYAEIHITINPVGMEKAEVIGIRGDSDSETTGVEMFQVLTVAIHRWRNESKELLKAHWDAVRQQEKSV